MLRGNHECDSINRVYGFFQECRTRYTLSLWRSFCQVFDVLPIAACVGGRIFCIHGGLSPHMKSLDDIKNIKRPCIVPESGMVTDFLWSDPDADIRGWAESDRGVSHTFGADVIKNFLETNDFDLIVRAHQVVEDGYEFFADRMLVTLFSAPNYCGEFDNAGAIMVVSKDLVCTFEVLEPGNHKIYNIVPRPVTPGLD